MNEGAGRSALLSSLQPDACQTDFDAVSMIRGELFFFKSGYVWRIRDGHLESGYPALASRHWRGIPSSIDAAFEDKSGNIWFFRGEQGGQASGWGVGVTRGWASPNWSDGSGHCWNAVQHLCFGARRTPTVVLFTQTPERTAVIGAFFDVRSNLPRREARGLMCGCQEVLALTPA